MRALEAAVLAFVLAWPVPGPAQDTAAPPRSEIVRKNRAPVSGEVLDVTLPRAVEAVLDNGLTVLILEDHRAPIVSVQLNISGAGPIYEPPERQGLAAMTARMIREGTTTRSSRQILQETATLGASLSSASSFGSAATVISASGLGRNMEQWFDLMRDILLNPAFPEAEFERVRDREKVGLAQQRTSSGFLAGERFNAAVFGDHPAGTVSATEASLDAMSTESLARWHRERYAPQNSILGIAGDVDAEAIVAELDRWLAGWERTDYVEELPPDPSRREGSGVYVVDRPGSAQTTIYLGNLAIDRRHPDYVPLTVMNEVLGGGAASRLFTNLREEKGYTYGAYSSFSALKYPGAWRAYADVRTEVTEPAMAEFFNEIRRIREEPVPREDLEEVKRSIVAAFALSLEQPASLLSYSTLREIYDFPDDYWENYPEEIMAVTPGDVLRVAEEYLDPDAMQIVAVGDSERIVPVMEGYGPVEVYDAEGNLVSD